jgi:hypothetical protein
MKTNATVPPTRRKPRPQAKFVDDGRGARFVIQDSILAVEEAEPQPRLPFPDPNDAASFQPIAAVTRERCHRILMEIGDDARRVTPADAPALRQAYRKFFLKLANQLRR